MTGKQEYRRKVDKTAFVSKQLGETPLEALERYRKTRKELLGIPMTYAGRLDPMAEGTLLVLIGDECKNKTKYLGLDKEYEIEIVFGLETDTYDILGLSSSIAKPAALDVDSIYLNHYVARFTQAYPPYSSKTVDGKQLHTLARAGTLPEIDEMPTKEVEIYSIERLGHTRITAPDLKNLVTGRIGLVRGDFRQADIIKRWNEILNDSSVIYDVLKVRVKCSSGTYMRSLAHKIGSEAGTGALALSIKRTKIITNPSS